MAACVPSGLAALDASWSSSVPRRLARVGVGRFAAHDGLGMLLQIVGEHAQRDRRALHLDERRVDVALQRRVACSAHCGPDWRAPCAEDSVFCTSASVRWASGESCWIAALAVARVCCRPSPAAPALRSVVCRSAPISSNFTLPRRDDVGKLRLQVGERPADGRDLEQVGANVDAGTFAAIGDEVERDRAGR